MPAISRLLLLACTMSLVGCGSSTHDTPTTPPSTDPTVVDVFTPGNVFSPFSVTVPLNGTVRFNISGAAHNVAFDRRVSGAPADIPVVSNTVVSRTFATKGTFSYDCTVHPGMSGQIVVQ